MADLHPIVEFLTTQRIGSGLSQRRIASLMGTSQSAISEIENGITSPTLTTLNRYAAVLGLEIVAQPCRVERPGIPSVPAKAVNSND